jgi:predicted nucleic acid-binding protein
MKKLKIYLDTSVISRLDQQEQPERMAESHKLWDMIKVGKFEVVISDVTITGVNVITALEGYKDLLIYSPSSLIEGDEQ